MRKKVYIVKVEFEDEGYPDVNEEEFDTLREAKRYVESYSIGDKYLAAGGPDAVITAMAIDEMYVDDRYLDDD